MLCGRCHRVVASAEPACTTCGLPVPGREGGAYDLMLPDGSRIALSGVVTIGRSSENMLQLADRTVSRRHAQVSVAAGSVLIRDLDSSHGSRVDGKKLTGTTGLSDGSTIVLGDVTLRVERRRDAAEAGATIVVPVAGGVEVSEAGLSVVDEGHTSVGYRPRVRTGWSLKRLAATEGERRWVLRDTENDRIVRFGDDEAALFQMIDGATPLPDLMVEAEQRFGDEGVGRLARMLSELSERGFMDTVDGAPTDVPRNGPFANLIRPREWAIAGTSSFFEGLYSRIGWVLFTRPALMLIGLVCAVGLAAYVGALLTETGTPFAVADRVELGALVFVLGRFVMVALHEIAHALTMEAYGRHVPRAGIKTVVGVPFAFVDTTESWFEPRRNRVAVSAAGPVSDAFLGGVFALAALGVGDGSMRDVLFQLALAAYVGAIININPMLDRDGYHMIVDYLGEPKLRERARDWLRARLSGRPLPAGATANVRRYAFATVIWLFVMIGFAILLSQIYYPILTALAPDTLVQAVFGIFYLVLFVPVIMVIGRPLLEGRREARAVDG